MRTHARQLAAIARREGLGADDAVDAVQDAIALVLERPDLLAAPGDELARVLATVVRNAARNARRRHHRARPHVVADDAALAGGATPDRVASDGELVAQLAGCMASLADVQRQVVTLRVLEELSGAEAGRRLGLTAGHIAVLLHRARAHLARCMLAHGDAIETSPASARSTMPATNASGRAPIARPTSRPSRHSTSVGVARTSNRRARSRSAPTSTSRTSKRPA
nr:sigma-70 family RNA polymerase sigma factor [Kofleriaceae bacterium]